MLLGAEEEEPQETETNKTLVDGVKKDRAKFTTEELQKFMNWPEYKYWRGFLKLTPDERFLRLIFH